MHSLKKFLLILPVWILSTPCIAQETDDKNVFVLPEFAVEADAGSGYQATNSLTGTFLDTPLKDSPFAIDVFMPDLIADTGSTDMREILAYDSGLQLENTIGAQTDDNYSLGVEFDARGINNAETDIVTRGFRAPTLKNGFFTKTRVDTVNIARVERAGGPQSLLYGIGAISGITNVITKRPLPEARYSSELFLGTNDFFRATAEATGPAWSGDTASLGYIVTAAYQEEGTDFPHEESESFFVSPALQLRAWDATSVYLSLEQGLRRQEGTGPKDAAHPRSGIIDPETGAPSGKRITGDNATFLEDYLGHGHYVNLGGPDTWIEDDILTVNLEMTQRIGKHFRLLVALNRDEQDREQQAYALNPSVRERFENGTFLEDYLIYTFGRTYEDRVTEQARVALLASYEFLGGQHSFVVGRQELSQGLTNVEFPESSVLEADGTYNEWPADGSSIRYGGEALVPLRWENRYKEWYQGNYVLYQASMWKGRINPVLGYRWDRSMTEFLRADFDEDGNYKPPYDPLVDRGSRNGKSNNGEPFRQETPTLGLSVSISDNLSIYGTYAEGIALANVTQRDGLDRGFPPEFTRSREVGAKVSFWGGKISGRLTYFELEKRGGVRYSFYAPNPARGRFNPDEPITAALKASQNPNVPGDVRKFMDYLGIYDLETGDFTRLPTELPGVQLLVEGDSRFFIFPFGDAQNPGTYDPDSNTAPDGYGGDLVAYFQQLREREATGASGEGSPDFIWAFQGNLPGEDRGAYHNYNEQSQGYEARLQITPVDNWQMILSYTYTTVEITEGVDGLVDTEVYTGIEPWFWYLPPGDFADPSRPGTYKGDLSSGVSNTDVPKHSFTFWTKYEFLDGFLEGLDFRFGARYTSERAAESPWSNGGLFVTAIHSGAGDNVKAPVPAFTLYDIGLGYKWQWRGLDWRLNLNVRNLFDKTVLTATSANTNVFGQPELTRYYLEGRDIRVSLRVDF